MAISSLLQQTLKLMQKNLFPLEAGQSPAAPLRAEGRRVPVLGDTEAFLGQNGKNQHTTGRAPIKEPTTLRNTLGSRLPQIAICYTPGFKCSTATISVCVSVVSDHATEPVPTNCKYDAGHITGTTLRNNLGRGGGRWCRLGPSLQVPLPQEPNAQSGLDGSNQWRK